MDITCAGLIVYEMLVYNYPSSVVQAVPTNDIFLLVYRFSLHYDKYLQVLRFSHTNNTDPVLICSISSISHIIRVTVWSRCGLGYVQTYGYTQ